MRLEMVGVPTLEHKSKISDLIAKYGDDGFRNTGQKWFVSVGKEKRKGTFKNCNIRCLKDVKNIVFHIQ